MPPKPLIQWRESPKLTMGYKTVRRYNLDENKGQAMGKMP